MKTICLAVLTTLSCIAAPLYASTGAMEQLSSYPGYEASEAAAPYPVAVRAVPYSAEKLTGDETLPKTVRAFLDTLAYAEGTDDNYNYIFTFATFEGYSDHPRQVKCAGRLCSDAAGRYQFLSDTWDELAKGLNLPDFSPASQDKACVEKITGLGAYDYVVGSDDYNNFRSALRRLNSTWASLPGSPYGQPTHPTKDLWAFYQTALAKY